SRAWSWPRRRRSSRRRGACAAAPVPRDTTPCERSPSRRDARPTGCARPGRPCAWRARALPSWRGGRRRDARAGAPRSPPPAPRHEGRVCVGPADLVDVEEGLLAGELRQLLLELLDLGALLADHDAGPCSVDVDLRLVGGALDVDLRDARVVEPLLQEVADLD